MFLTAACLLASAAALSTETDLNDHLRSLVANEAALRPASRNLPVEAARSIFHYDPLLFAAEDTQESLLATISHEVESHAADPTTRRPYAACGPQATAKQARADLAMAAGDSNRIQVSQRPN